MYSVVLATMLTAGTATPDFFFAKARAAATCTGCYGCSGCYGCTGCYGCGGCYGGYTRTYSCSGCYGYSGYSGSGCYGCGGCWGGCWGSCSGCWGGCSGCYGYSSYSCSGCYGCGGCYGVTASFASCSGFTACYGCGGGCFGGVIGTTPVISAPIGCIGGCIGGYPSIGGSVIIGSGAPIIGGTLSTTGTEGSGIATVTIKAPTDVVIEVNGTTLARKGEEQTFNTPTLSATGKHTYDFVATLTRDGKSAKRTRTIEVRPGGEVNVDFSELVAELDRNQDRARVLVALPEDAELFVDGTKMSATGASRKFQTPLLETGKSYSYELRATMKRDGQMHESVQKIRIEAGKEFNVEFTETSFVKVNNKIASR